MIAIVNGHKFEKISEKFNFGDGLFIDMPPCYVLDDETVPESYFYDRLQAETVTVTTTEEV